MGIVHDVCRYFVCAFSVAENRLVMNIDAFTSNILFNGGKDWDSEFMGCYE